MGIKVLAQIERQHEGGRTRVGGHRMGAGMEVAVRQRDWSGPGRETGVAARRALTAAERGLAVPDVPKLAGFRQDSTGTGSTGGRP